MKEKIWTEYYRPEKIEDMVLLPRIREQFENGLKGNYILSGSWGIGKTSLAKILIKGGSYKYFKSSQRLGIGDIQSKLEEYCNTWNPLDNNKKIIFFDEFMVTTDFQEAIRGFIEESSAKGVKWLITTNYPYTISGPLKSRFKLLDFDFKTEDEKDYLVREYTKKAMAIIKEHGLKVDEDGANTIVRSKFPDFRAVIEELHSIYITGKTGNDIKAKGFDYRVFFSRNIDDMVLWDYINDNWKGLEKGVYSIMGRGLIDFIISKKPEFSKKIPVVALLWKDNEMIIEKSSDPGIVMYSFIVEARKEIFR